MGLYKTLTKLKPWQCANIVRIITDNTPDQLKFTFMLWNINAVKELIKMKFNINLSTSTVHWTPSFRPKSLKSYGVFI